MKEKLVYEKNVFNGDVVVYEGYNHCNYICKIDSYNHCSCYIDIEEKGFNNRGGGFNILSSRRATFEESILLEMSIKKDKYTEPEPISDNYSIF